MLTESFPTPEHPGRGIFIREQVKALSQTHAVTVLFPRPTLPGIRSSSLEPRAEALDSNHPDRPAAAGPAPRLSILRPGYFYVPRNRSIRVHQLARLLRRTLGEVLEPFDIVHAHWLAPAGAAAVLGTAGLNIPVVVTAHAGDIYRDLRHAKHVRVAQQVAKQASRIIAVADYFREPLARVGAAPEKLSVIHNGVDLNVFVPGDRDKARAELQLPAGVPLYLYIGNLEEAKGAADLVETFFAHAPAAAMLVVTGTGPLWGRFARRAAASGGRMILRGWQPHEAVARYLTAADCFVLPSYAEGNPVTVLESLCCGRPVIGSSIPAIAPLIEEGKSGLLISPGDIPALGLAMRILPKMQWDAVAIARQAAVRYGWSAVAARISEVYAEAVAEDRVRRTASCGPEFIPAAPPR
ncbi:MAG TPA: glycosyltransferase [Gammaproteobacteria bacterium]|nr:glycosyltransferase [Gammaproteobacteria bacterium]